MGDLSDDNVELVIHQDDFRATKCGSLRLAEITSLESDDAVNLNGSKALETGL